MVVRKLEEIFYGNGKWAKKNGEKVNPEPIDEGKIVGPINTNFKHEFLKEIRHHIFPSSKNHNKINAYSVGDSLETRTGKGFQGENTVYSTSYYVINFYKI